MRAGPDPSPETRSGGAVGTERSEHYGFVADLERALQSIDEPEEIMRVAARMLGEHLRVDRSAYAEAEADEDHFTMTGSYTRGLPPLVGRMAMSDFSANTLRCMRAGEPYVLDDAETDPRVLPEQRAIYHRTGIAAVICTPLHKEGRFVAAMAVHHATPRHWTADDVAILDAVVVRCWESLARVHARASARDSEARYRSVAERTTDAIWIADAEGRYVDANPAACALLGHTLAQHRELTLLDVARPEDLDRLADLQARLATGEPVTEVWHLRTRAGGTVPVELSMRQEPDGRPFSIGRDITERLRVEAERERLLAAEREIAETLQRSLLPRALPELERLAAAARYMPSAEHAQPGGDWYDLLPLDDGARVALVVGDVVGHGPAAAAVMGQLRSAVAAYLLDGHGPAAALERLDRFAVRVADAGGSSCACLVLDLRDGALTWATAGHPPAVLAEQDGSARLLAGPAGAVLGLRPREPYRDSHGVLPPGGSLVLYTDGLVERRGEVLDVGLSRLVRLAGAAADLPPEELASALVSGSLGEQGPADDVALVVVRAVPEPLVARLPAVPPSLGAMRRRVRHWAAAAGLAAETVDDLQLALGEAAANAVEHAYPPGRAAEFDVALSRDRTGGVQVTVRDEGRWRPVPADRGFRGHGLRVLRELGRDLHIDRAPNGTRVRFRVPAPAATEPPPVQGRAPRDAPDPRPISVRRTARTGGWELALTGDLDLAARAEVAAALAEVRGAAVVVDLTGVGYLASAGIALLAEAAAQSRVSLVVAAGSAAARAVEVTGLTAAVATEVVSPGTPA
ncbi:SpoIIE family protein phosphatase [Pseudonocardia xishanensis]|uniref:SpoIIE family protein phosphatase n=1 Tax=Pseudonocardia xishanensis TaxID=630995 RepID=A0ABP8RW69_9PSEU